MKTLPIQLRFLVLAPAGWLNRHQHDAVDYLREENRLLRDGPPGPAPLKPAPVPPGLPGARRLGGGLKPGTGDGRVVDRNVSNVETGSAGEFDGTTPYPHDDISHAVI